MNKKYQSLLQIRSVLDRNQIPELWTRAQRAFEKKSGWKRQQIQSTLDKFSKLNGVNKFFFGSLLVGQAFIPRREEATRKPARTVSSRKKSTSTSASRA